MFIDFKRKLQARFVEMTKNEDALFVTSANPDSLWETYLAAFPLEERQENTCNCCKQFIRHYGAMVVIDSNCEIKTLWDFEAEGSFDAVAKAMNEAVKSKDVANLFVSKQPRLGTDSNVQRLETGGTVTWNHLFLNLPAKFVTRSSSTEDTIKGNARSSAQVFQRALEELTQDSVETVLELIAQNSLYRGAEFKGVLELFLKHKKAYLKAKNKSAYAWKHSAKETGAISSIRNSAIGTLLVNLSANMEIDAAVTAFERVMAPSNYKRPQAIITKRMIEEAEKTLAEMNLLSSLKRKLATPDDIKVNNVLFVNRGLAKNMSSALGILEEDVAVNPRSMKKVEEISAKDFVEKILPKAESVEVLFENKHASNLVSIIGPQDPTAPTLFKWSNPYSWCYQNALADSMKEKVKAAGGKVDGYLRISLEWFNFDDLDLHVHEPDGAHIYYAHKRSHRTGGELDVDMNAGSGRSRTPVENIIYLEERKMIEGTYRVAVNQFSKRESIDVGFSMEMEVGGEIYDFEYNKPVSGTVTVAEFTYKRGEGIKFVSQLQSRTVSKDLWGMKTNQFQKVSMIMKSPNHWDGEGVGNEHLFFIIDKAKNEERPRGFFNEFLKEDLMKNKRVFEALASRSTVEPAEKELSGLGFSSTQSNSVLCKVTGAFTRTLKINF